MIAKRAYKYCREDLSLVENYAEAMADHTQVWHVHHRDEIRVLPSGMIVRRSIQDLIDADRYYKCPENELIFVTPAMHNTIHFLGCVGNRKGSSPSPETRLKLSAANLGKRYSPEVNKKKGFDVGHKFSDETKNKIRQKAIGRRMSPETRAKISATLKGSVIPPETRKKISEAGFRRWARVRAEKEATNA